MKCPSLLSSLLASVIFLVVGAAPAFPQTSEQALMNLEMIPDSVLEVLPGLGHGQCGINHGEDFAKKVEELLRETGG